MKNFKPIDFQQEKSQNLVIKQATAYPTTFVVKIDKDKLKELSEFTGAGTYQLIIKDKEKEKIFHTKKAEILTEEGRDYIQVTFDYSGYDQYSELLFKINQNETINLIK